MARTKAEARRRRAGGGLGVTGGEVIKTETGTASGTVQVRKPHRYKPGTVALREIRRYQRGTGLLLKKLPFIRLVREIAQELILDIRFDKNAIPAIQEAAEQYLVEKLALAQSVAIYAGRETILIKDLQFACLLDKQTHGHIHESNDIAYTDPPVT